MAVFTNHIARLRIIVRDVLAFAPTTGPQDRKCLQKEHAGLTRIITDPMDIHMVNAQYAIGCELSTTFVLIAERV